MNKAEKYLEKIDKKSGSNPVGKYLPQTYSREAVKFILTDFHKSEIESVAEKEKDKSIEEMKKGYGVLNLDERIGFDMGWQGLINYLLKSIEK